MKTGQEEMGTAQVEAENKIITAVQQQLKTEIDVIKENKGKQDFVKSERFYRVQCREDVENGAASVQSAQLPKVQQHY